MKNFLKIAEGVDVTRLLLSLKQQPELWNQNPLRKIVEGTPHKQMDDIWVRFRNFSEFNPENPKEFIGPHFPEWYPSYRKLPQIKEFVYGLMAKIEATHLGGILITRIPPGGRIEAHSDRGWHPEFYNTKLYIVLQSDRCTFRVEDEQVVMQQGEIWWLDNTVEHEVWNDGEIDRMTLIICMRTEP